MKNVLSILLIAVLAAACAAAEERRSDRQSIVEAYERHAGDSRDETVFPAVDRWFPLEGGYMALRTRDHKYFLLELEPACARELTFGSVPRVSIDQQTRNQLTRQDRIILGDRRCRIQGIQRVDHEALHAELDEKGLHHPFVRLPRS